MSALLTSTQNLLPILPFLLPPVTDANNMHSDAVMLQGHVSSSPRLSSSSTSPAKRDIPIEDDDGDQSCCSEDSVLSVGKEGSGGNGGGGGDSSSCGETKHDDENMSNLSVDEQSSVNQDFDVNSSDESMCQNNDSLLMASATLRIPVPVVRPNPSRFQEEFIRKSQLYAEELMKQQMQFMAAARASAFTTIPTVGSSQSEFRVPNVENFHSHLNAISKLAAATNSPFVQSPSQSLNQLQQQLNHLPFINNNIHDQRLKFSIDNILKADFGSKLTESLMKSSKNSGSKKNNSSNKIKPMDLTSLTQEMNQEVSSPISSPDQKSTSENESSSSKSSDPMVWPAWVYCTRYSDRPSSGECFVYVFTDGFLDIACYYFGFSFQIFYIWNSLEKDLYSLRFVLIC